MNGLVQVAARLARDTQQLVFDDPVAFVYNPLEYAWDAHRAYLERYGSPPKRVLFLGMNPGPWGMAQTGIPFGEVGSVRDWLDIRAAVRPPERVHGRRPVQGLACPRSEVSGRRLWGLMRKRFVTADAFFQGHFVANYCPLLFLTAQAGNITPDKLPAARRAALFEACDRALAETMLLLQPAWAIGIGRFAEQRLAAVKAALPGLPFELAAILHPSPASPAANRDWEGQTARRLEALGVWQNDAEP